MKVTLMCDASFCPNYKVAGYGYWIASRRKKDGGGGQIKWEISDTNTAEMMAVCNALFSGIKYGLLERGDEILIQTDSTSAIERFEAKKEVSLNEQQRVVLAYYEKLVLAMGFKIVFRHVKAHTMLQERRYAANRACDLRARKHMRAARFEKIASKHLPIIKDILNEQPHQP